MGVVEEQGVLDSLPSVTWKEIRCILIEINLNVFCFVPIFDRCNQQKAIKVKLPTTNYLKVSIMLM